MNKEAYHASSEKKELILFDPKTKHTFVYKAKNNAPLKVMELKGSACENAVIIQVRGDDCLCKEDHPASFEGDNEHRLNFLTYLQD
ncbi:MAG: hypothetical protein ACOC80_12325, partial [Petrotogales bacterium]